MKRNDIKLIATTTLPTEYGEFDVRVYEDGEKKEHVVLSKEGFDTTKPVLVRIHSECLTGEVFHSQKCDCKEQLDLAMERIGREGGVIIYLRQEGRGIGLGNKIRAYHLQEQGLDTVEANEELGFAPDERIYEVAGLILHDLNVDRIKLLTNNPDKVENLEKFGIKVVERLPIEVKPKNGKDRKYLKTKKDKMGHILENV